jgi:site-specific DNA-methyltransferase (adenine-specific)
LQHQILHGDSADVMGTVLDPFAGSGTTMVAAKKLGFSSIGIEEQQHYVDIIKARVA